MRSVQKHALPGTGDGDESSPIKRYLSIVQSARELSERDKYVLSEDLLSYLLKNRSGTAVDDGDVFSHFLTYPNVEHLKSFVSGNLIPCIEDVMALDGFEMANVYPTESGSWLTLYAGVNGTASISHAVNKQVSNQGGVRIVISIKEFTRGRGVFRRADDNVDKVGRIRSIIGLLSKDGVLQRAEELLSVLGISKDNAAAAIETLKNRFNPEASGPAVQPALPETPPQYAYKPRMEGGIVKYLQDNWGPYISAGIMSRPDLKRVDPAAYQALRNWLKNPANVLPEDLYLPTITEATDRALASRGLGDLTSKEAAKLASAAVRRAHKDPTPK